MLETIAEINNGAEEGVLKTLVIIVVITAIVAALLWFSLRRVEPSWAAPVTGAAIVLGALIALFTLL